MNFRVKVDGCFVIPCKLKRNTNLKDNRVNDRVSFRVGTAVQVCFF